MEEVLNVSSSQPANNIITHLYNTQESHIPYSKDAVVEFNNNVFMTCTKESNGRTKYEPRNIIYDLRGGFGSLAKYEYHEANFHGDGEYDLMETGKRIAKHEYQVGLDIGHAQANSLKPSNIKFWTDYNKLIYDPRSLVTLANWDYNSDDYGTHRNFSQLKFDRFDIGKEEYNSCKEDRMEEFRLFVERCDLLQGMNFFTEIDSAWGGFTNEYLLDINDEFFDGKSTTKHNIWTYGILNGNAKLKLDHIVSRINTLIELAQNSSLLFPLNLDTQKLASCTLDDSSNLSEWVRTGFGAMFINSIWGLNNRLRDPIAMNKIEEELLRGNKSINIVNEIKMLENSERSGVVDLRSLDKAALYENLPNMKVDTYKEDIDFSLSNRIGSEYFVKSYIKTDENDHLPEEGKYSCPTNVYVNKKANETLTIDTFPSLIPKKKYDYQFAVNGNFKDELKDFRKIIQRNKNCYLVEDQNELIENISHLIEEYTIGYDESEEEFD